MDYSIEELLEMAENEEGICTKCGEITAAETDQDKGWCEDCQSNTVVSAAMLLI